MQTQRLALFAVAPMVGQCDLPFRLLCRRHGASVVWGEMLLAGRFAADEVRALFGTHTPHEAGDNAPDCPCMG